MATKWNESQQHQETGDKLMGRVDTLFSGKSELQDGLFALLPCTLITFCL